MYNRIVGRVKKYFYGSSDVLQTGVDVTLVGDDYKPSSGDIILTLDNVFAPYSVNTTGDPFYGTYNTQFNPPIETNISGEKRHSDSSGSPYFHNVGLIKSPDTSDLSINKHYHNTNKGTYKADTVGFKTPIIIGGWGRGAYETGLVNDPLDSNTWKVGPYVHGFGFDNYTSVEDRYLETKNILNNGGSLSCTKGSIRSPNAYEVFGVSADAHIILRESSACTYRTGTFNSGVFTASDIEINGNMILTPSGAVSCTGLLTISDKTVGGLEFTHAKLELSQLNGPRTYTYISIDPFNVNNQNYLYLSEYDQINGAEAAPSIVSIQPMISNYSYIFDRQFDVTVEIAHVVFYFSGGGSTDFHYLDSGVYNPSGTICYTQAGTTCYSTGTYVNPLRPSGGILSASFSVSYGSGHRDTVFYPYSGYYAFYDCSNFLNPSANGCYNTTFVGYYTGINSISVYAVPEFSTSGMHDTNSLRHPAIGFYSIFGDVGSYSRFPSFFQGKTGFSEYDTPLYSLHYNSNYDVYSYSGYSNPYNGQLFGILNIYEDVFNGLNGTYTGIYNVVGYFNSGVYHTVTGYYYISW